jgi:hypothetical protein
MGEPAIMLGASNEDEIVVSEGRSYAETATWHELLRAWSEKDRYGWGNDSPTGVSSKANRRLHYCQDLIF